MSEVHIIAFITPAEGKAHRVEELLRQMSEKTYESEPNTTRYHLHREIGGNEFVMTETYKTKADSEAHLKSENFQSFAKMLQEESLLAAAPKIITCTSLAGYENRQEGLKQKL